MFLLLFASKSCQYFHANFPLFSIGHGTKNPPIFMSVHFEKDEKHSKLIMQESCTNKESENCSPLFFHFECIKTAGR